MNKFIIFFVFFTIFTIVSGGYGPRDGQHREGLNNYNNGFSGNSNAGSLGHNSNFDRRIPHGTNQGNLGGLQNNHGSNTYGNHDHHHGGYKQHGY